MSLEKKILAAVRKVWLDVLRMDPALDREVLHLAHPVVLGLISITAIGVTDTIMVGRLSAEALAATGLGAVVLWLAGWVLRAVEVAVQALVARRYGEGAFAECGKVVDNGLVVSMGLSLILMTGLGFGAPFLVGAMSGHPLVAENATAYIQIFVSALAFSGVLYVIRGFFSGIGKTRIYLITAFSMMVINIALNFVLIFGHFGFPRLEVRGAALGSALAIFMASVIIMLYMLGITGHNYRREYALLKHANLNFQLIKEIIRLAAPNALRGVMVIGGFGVFYALAGQLDVIQVAVVNVVINVQSVSFMPGYGFGVAAAALIGQNLGAGNPEKGEHAAYESVKLGMLFMGTIGLIFLAVPHWVINIFTDNPQVIDNALFPLRIIGVVQIIDAAGMIFGSALEGAGNTRWVMAAEVFVNWGIFLPTTYLFAFLLGFGRYGLWIAWSLYMVAFGVICFLKFRTGTWKQIKI